MGQKLVLNGLSNARCVGNVDIGQIDTVDYRSANCSRMVELASLTRIAGELHRLSRRERATSQPLKQDTKRLIDHSKRLLEQSRAVSEQAAAARRVARQG